MFIALAVLVIYYVLIEVCILYSSIKKEALSSLLTANVLPYLIVKSVLVS